MKKHKIKLIGLGLRILCVLICIYLFLNILFFDNYSALSVIAQRSNLDQLITNTETIQQQNAHLEEEIDRLQNDDHYIESIARKYYSMVRSGETVYVFRER
jgi:cell division protein FtsB